MATRKKSANKTRKSTPTKSRRAAAAKSARKRAARQASVTSLKKRQAKTPTNARGSRKVAGAAKAREKLAIAKRKRKASNSAAPAKAQSATKSRMKDVARKTTKARTLGVSKKTGSRSRVATSSSLKVLARQAKVKLRSKTGGKDETPQTSARTAPTTPPLSKATPSALGTSDNPAPVAVAPISPAKSPAPVARAPKPLAREEASTAAKPAKATGQRQGFKLNEFVVYPAHGVGQIVAIEEQEVAGFKLELFVISFSKDKMTLRVPTSKVVGVGMRKISDPDTARRSLEILTGRARVKRTMWSRRAQEYETKINSGDINAIAEVVRDLYRSEAQPEQSYSERQLYEAALDRMVREIAAVQKSTEIDALKAVEAQLQKSQNRAAKLAGAASEASDPRIEEAA